MINFNNLNESEKIEMNKMLDKLKALYKEKDLLEVRYKALSEDIEFLQIMIMRFSNKCDERYLNDKINKY